MAYPQATIFSLGGERIRQIDYEETEHFQVTRRFLNDPQRMLRDLLD
jgi:predicted ATPase